MIRLASQASIAEQVDEHGKMELREPRVRLNISPFAVAYLCTGTTLAVLGQIVTNQGAAHPSTQLVAWTKYVATFAINWVILRGLRAPSSRESTKQQRLLRLAVGALDVIAYAFFCIGFAYCGSALSSVVFAASGQFFTATTRLLLLRRTLTRQQLLAVCVVVLGLGVRALPTLKSHQQQDAALWMALITIALSAFTYSLLGAVYEWLVALEGPTINHAEIALQSSGLGLLVLTCYQLMFTWPRWEALVAGPMRERELEAWRALGLYAVFGAAFTLHSAVQSRLLAREGSQTVAIVNALFCTTSPPPPPPAAVNGHQADKQPAWLSQQCLTVPSGVSTAMVTVGALVWTLAKPPAMPPKRKTE